MKKIIIFDYLLYPQILFLSMKGFPSTPSPYLSALNKPEIFKCYLFKVFFFILNLSLFLLLDWITKSWVSSFFINSFNKPLIPGFLDLVFVENTGIAFGLFAGNNGFWEYFTLLLILIGFIFFRKKIFTNIFHMFVSSLIFAGALGNWIDRVIHGHVIDFIDVHILEYHWPAFNLADAYLTIGFVCILLESVLSSKRTFKKTT